MSMFRYHGASLTDTVFTLDDPPITWNVTRLERAAEAGRFGPPITLLMGSYPGSDWESGNLLRERVDFIKQRPDLLDRPVMLIENPPGSEFRFLCFVDGQHRATARWELGLPTISTYVIPHDLEGEFRVILERIDGMITQVF